jgi:hypothetical protein
MSAVRKWKVKGIAMVPVEVEIRVDGISANDAYHRAEELVKPAGALKKYIVANSVDEDCVFDFRPGDVEELK